MKHFFWEASVRIGHARFGAATTKEKESQSTRFFGYDSGSLLLFLSVYFCLSAWMEWRITVIQSLRYTRAGF